MLEEVLTGTEHLAEQAREELPFDSHRMKELLKVFEEPAQVPAIAALTLYTTTPYLWDGSQAFNVQHVFMSYSGGTVILTCF